MPGVIEFAASSIRSLFQKKKEGPLSPEGRGEIQRGERREENGQGPLLVVPPTVRVSVGEGMEPITMAENLTKLDEMPRRLKPWQRKAVQRLRAQGIGLPEALAVVAQMTYQRVDRELNPEGAGTPALALMFENAKKRANGDSWF